MFTIYRHITRLSAPALRLLLKHRVKIGKEDARRVFEKQGIINHMKPKSPLIWLHAASVGEAQSALILIEYILQQNRDMNIIVTTGTVTSANLMEQKLPKRAFHQYAPLDHPQWVKNFLDYWNPKCVFWMESELWPNILCEIKSRKIPAALINARMSPRSFKVWKHFKTFALNMLSTFDLILCQTAEDTANFKELGVQNISHTGNIKYSAAKLNVNKADNHNLEQAIHSRPVWLYASTHKGEETIACELHKRLKSNIPELLTIIVPRHPNRRDEIMDELIHYDLSITLRGEERFLPDLDTDIYIADTIGELGLFYDISPIACIGRSFSDDGGGGHNPIEAAQFGCVVLHGPHVQNLQNIFDDLSDQNASIAVNNTQHFHDVLLKLFKDEKTMQNYQNAALEFCQKKNHILDSVLQEIAPLLDRADLTVTSEMKRT